VTREIGDCGEVRWSHVARTVGRVLTLLEYGRIGRWGGEALRQIHVPPRKGVPKRNGTGLEPDPAPKPQGLHEHLITSNAGVGLGLAGQHPLPRSATRRRSGPWRFTRWAACHLPATTSEPIDSPCAFCTPSPVDPPSLRISPVSEYQLHNWHLFSWNETRISARRLPSTVIAGSDRLDPTIQLSRRRRVMEVRARPRQSFDR
jgi:hypothetical protein